VCAVLDWGGLAEVAVANEVNTFKIPDGLTFDRAICFTNSYATSAAALLWPHLLRLEAGETLLVHGAAGGVGLAAIEIGKIIGATVIATAGSAEKLEAAKAHGADHVINYREGEFRKTVNELTDGRGANAIYDPVGGDVFKQSLRCIAPEGRIMPVGFAGGTIQEIPANILLVKNITVTGLNMGYYIGWSPDDVRDEMAPRIHRLMQQVFDWFEAEKIKPRIWKTFKLEDFQDAMVAVLDRAAIGRVAVVMDEEARRLGQ
jgi:NADPH2:quinone reductase